MGNGVVPVEGGGAKTGAKYTEAEWQQMIMGMKREHKENIEKLRKEQDEALFKARIFAIKKFLTQQIFLNTQVDGYPFVPLLSSSVPSYLTSVRLTRMCLCQTWMPSSYCCC